MSARIGVTMLIVTLLGFVGCDSAAVDVGSHDDSEWNGASMNQIAEAYVKLVLSVGQHDEGYVDAYYGPQEWAERAKIRERSLGLLRARATELLMRVDAVPTPEDEMERLRRRYLASQLKALRAHVERLAGRVMTFDEESRALYDAVAPRHSDEHFQAIIDELDPLLPGSGALVDRYEVFKKSFIVPKDKLDAVFNAAIAECRARTRQHLDLPGGESFDVEYVNEKSWSAYNWYQGGFNSLIQVNTDLPIYIDRAIDLACHEGYPGHHVYNLMLEKALVKDRGWIEFSIYPLYSPQSLIAEGTANFGIEMAFPGDERTAYEREILFPIAGLDASRAEKFYEVQTRVQALSYAGNEAARQLLNGEIDEQAAADRLSRFALMPALRAEQRVRFIQKYRSYVINYNLGQDLVRTYVETRAGGDVRKRWEVFGELLSSPRLPSALSDRPSS